MARRALIVVPDLFFATRITETARALGIEVSEARSDRALEVARLERPDLVILDLEAPGDPLALGRQLRADAARTATFVVGFCSHVNVALRRRALESGIDQVLPRSALSAQLPGLLAPERLPRGDAGC